MTTSTKRPAGRRAQAQLMRIVNVPMRAVLGLPFPTPLGSRLMLVHLTGRRNWKLNLLDGQPVHIRLRGHDITARPELVSDVDQIESLLGVLVARNPRSASFIRIPRDAAGRFDHDVLENAARHGFRIVRWHPADAESARMMAEPTSVEPPTPEV